MWRCLNDAPLVAKARVVAYLHTTLVAMPSCFVIRYLEPNFMPCYFRLRPKWNLVKLFFFAFGFLCVLPYGYAWTLMPYPCNPTPVMLTGELNATDLMLQEMDCEVQDWLRTTRSLFLGPACLLVCAAVYIAFAWRGCFGLLRRMMLPFREFMPRVPYNGLGPFYTTLSCRSLATRYGHTDQYCWVHDLLGGPDLYVACCLMVTAFALSLILVPALAVLDKSMHPSGLGVGVAVAYVLSKAMMKLADLSLGAPESLIEVVESELRSWRPDFSQISLGPSHAAQFLRERDLVQLADKAQAVQFSCDVHSMPDKNRYAGLMYRLYHHERAMLALEGDLIDAIASLDCMGVTLAMVDPEYEELHRLGFNHRLILTGVYQSAPCDVLVMQDGFAWREYGYPGPKMAGYERLDSSG